MTRVMKMMTEEIEKEVPSDDDSEEEPTLGKVKGSKIEITKSLVKNGTTIR